MLGIEFLPIAMGLFGISEILDVAIKPYAPQTLMKVRLRDLYPTKEEIMRSVSPIFRGSILGFFVGLLPGPAAVTSTFISYSLEKRLSRTPEEFGKGMIEGVVGPESANNSAVMGSMIPLLTLGIPFAAPAAVILAGLRIHNVEPGPLLFQNHPGIFWTFIAALYLGNVMLLILNLPLVGFWGRISTIRPQMLIPFIITICLVGVYSIRNSILDVWIMIVAGIIGFIFLKFGYPVAPFVIGNVLGPMTENNLRKTLWMFKGDLSLFFGRRIALVFLFLAIGVIGYKVFSYVLRRNFKPK
jgi:putative tricarboxylic transport membrane protein